MSATKINANQLAFYNGSFLGADLAGGLAVQTRPAIFSPGGGTFASTTTSTSVQNSTAEANLDQFFTMPASFLIARTSVMFSFSGKYIQASGTVTLRVYIGSTNFLDFGAFTPPTTAVEKGWDCTGELVCDTIGATGTVRGKAILTFNNAAPIIANSTADFVTNTTVTKDLKMTAQWSAANAGNVINTKMVTVKIF